jgi:hypothetical protein
MAKKENPYMRMPAEVDQSEFTDDVLKIIVKQ